jgi:hypothetical protein
MNAPTTSTGNAYPVVMERAGPTRRRCATRRPSTLRGGAARHADRAYRASGPPARAASARSKF